MKEFITNILASFVGYGFVIFWIIFIIKGIHKGKKNNTLW